MTKKRFTKVENIFDIGDEGVKDNQTKIEYYYALDMFDLLNEQHEENITLNNQLNNFKLHSKDLESENQLLKKALRELLENDGNAYMIDLMDKIFDLNYREWYNPTGHNSEDYVDWEEELQLKELRDLYD